MTACPISPCRLAPCSALLVALLLGGPAAWAAPAGEVTHVSGALMSRKADGTSKILAPKSQVEAGDLLATAADTYARVKFTDGGEVTLRPNTQLRVDSFSFDKNAAGKDSAVFSLLKGGLRTITGLVGKRKPNSYEMRTTVATIGIRGTNYGLLFCQEDCQNLTNNDGQVPANGLHLDVADGIISVTNQGGVVLFSAGQFGYVQNITTPATPVPPSQGVTNNMPGFGGPPAGNNAECAVQ
ncbi:MAG TPA: FecR family protein [Burkholderiales bacterium]|nr:FecR family protein [Burkholderiales bacterium]